jgi:DNA-binding CsgD family transcriptional regulator
VLASVDPVIGSNPAGLAGLVSTIGEQEFGSELLTFSYGVCGAEHCTVFTLNAAGARGVATAGAYSAEVAHRQIALYLQNQRWQRDPMVAQACKQLEVQTAGIARMTVRELPGVDFREILYGPTKVCDRVLLCGRSAAGIIGLSLLRATGNFSNEDIVHVHEASSLLMAIVNKHIDVTFQEPNLSQALTSLVQIEECFTKVLVPLSQREKQVCARILHGLTSLGIALELGISEETVMTYRKRAYERLSIGSQRELLLWYLDTWSALHLGGHRWKH